MKAGTFSRHVRVERNLRGSLDLCGFVEDEGAVEQAKTAMQVDSAYDVIGAALQYLSLYDKEAALGYAKKLEKEKAS